MIEKCRICDKEGKYFAIPARLAIIKGDEKVNLANVDSLKNLPKLKKGYNYSLKPLRTGFIYIKDPTLKKVHSYQINDKGLISEIDLNLNEEAKFDSHLDCFRNRGKLANALVINLPESNKKRRVWATFSVVKWTQDMLNKVLASDEYNSNMTPYNIGGKNNVVEEGLFIYHEIFPYITQTDVIKEKNEKRFSEKKGKGNKKDIEIHQPVVTDNIVGNKNIQPIDSERLEENFKHNMSYKSPQYNTLFTSIVDGELIDIRSDSIEKMVISKNNKWDKKYISYMPLLDIVMLMNDITHIMADEVDALNNKNERQLLVHTSIDLFRKSEVELKVANKYNEIINSSYDMAEELTIDRTSGKVIFVNSDKKLEYFNNIFNEKLNKIQKNNISIPELCESEWNKEISEYYKEEDYNSWLQSFRSEVKSLNDNYLTYLDSIFCDFYKSEYVKSYFNFNFRKTNHLVGGDLIFKESDNLIFISEFILMVGDVINCTKSFDMFVEDLKSKDMSESIFQQALCLNDKGVQDICKKNDNIMTLNDFISNSVSIANNGFKNELNAVIKILIIKFQGVLYRYIDIALNSKINKSLSIIRFLTGTSFIKMRFSMDVKLFLSIITDHIYTLNKIHLSAESVQNYANINRMGGPSMYEASGKQLKFNKLVACESNFLFKINGLKKNGVDSFNKTISFNCIATTSLNFDFKNISDDNFSFEDYLKRKANSLVNGVKQLPNIVDIIDVGLHIYSLSQNLNTFEKDLKDDALKVFHSITSSILGLASTVAGYMENVLESSFLKMKDVTKLNYFKTSLKTIASRCNVATYLLNAIMYTRQFFEFGEFADSRGIAILSLANAGLSIVLLSWALTSANFPFIGWYIAGILVIIIAFDIIIKKYTPSEFQQWLRKSFFGTHHHRRGTIHEDRDELYEITGKGFTSTPTN